MAKRWVGPTAGTLVRSGARYGAKYGPHAMLAWELAGTHVQAAARARLDELAARRRAFDHADGLRAGSVLRVVDHGLVVFVAYSGDEPVACYPQVAVPLDDLVRHADLDKRRTPQQHQERLLRSRARRAGARITRRAPRSRG